MGVYRSLQTLVIRDKYDRHILCMKPGSKDIKYYILITGQELIELKKYTGLMVEAYGLDHKIEKYQGIRPIGFWRWDLDCLKAVLEDVLKDYPDHKSKSYKATKNLIRRIDSLIKQAYD